MSKNINISNLQLPILGDHSVISNVVNKGLCSSCGVCAGQCPASVLQMGERANGDLSPALVGECLPKCNQCLVVCPFTEGVHDPRSLNLARFGKQGDEDAGFDESIGAFKALYAGFSFEHREHSSSGGLATWCLENLLRQGLVTKVAVVRRSTDPTHNLFEFTTASTVEEIRAAAGSVYHPVEISEIVKHILHNKNDRWAIMGVPCLCAAIRRTKRLNNRVPFVFGLACGMYQNTYYTQALLAKSGISTDNVASIHYRGKNLQSHPANFLFRAIAHDGHTGREIAYSDLPYFLGRNAYFRLGACNYCKDVFAETADACFMDAWLPEYMNDPKGMSLVVVRDSQIDRLFRQGLDANQLKLSPATTENIRRSQASHIRRKQVLIGMRMRIDGSQSKYSWLDRLDWRLQQYTEVRSKIAWPKYGRPHGLLVFWGSILDLLVMQQGLVLLRRSIGIVQKVLSSLRHSV